MNEFQQDDIKRIIQSAYINPEQLKDKTVLITGATGMIGSMLVYTLLELNSQQGLNITIIGMARNEAKMAQLFGESVRRMIQDIQSPIAQVDGPVDYIIHTANGTDSASFVQQPVETIETILTGTRHILEFAKAKAVQSLVYLSSMEVYGVPSAHQQQPLKEHEYGSIELMSERSSYSQGKRMAESLCYAYFKEYNVPVTVARLVQTISTNVGQDDKRVFAQFARSVAQQENIILHTTGATTRNYCYITDAVTAIFKLLLAGEAGESYNVANDKTAISIKGIADSLSQRYPETQVHIQMDGIQRGYNPEMITVLDTTKLQALNWQAEVGINEMFDRLIAVFQQRA